jgi:hypothetical protein
VKSSSSRTSSPSLRTFLIGNALAALRNVDDELKDEDLDFEIYR